jgi:DNA-binding CsgD family transcriptional regulator
VITDETRASVKKLAESGKTGAQIAKTLKISLPSVQNIKKALGLVKARA